MQFISLKNDKIMPLILINDDKILYDAYRSAMVAYYGSGNYTLYKDFFMKNYEILSDFFKLLNDNIKYSKHIKRR
ncbi:MULTISPECIES: hypothetical protein [unclassified Campylobacter]|uniref:hypothetical protein n=1 Tax=unclassified Campylobacter TaxID=2593542 RepID=UPI001237F9B0|nr:MULTISPECIES: hypothetical protein [unclassified Campylobacter]KAA6225326.1 hypothetical protein FMM57_08065 [Campylobacter sp. LR286c]KAA6225555.1 hypothetical protein FMM54_05855 [Campylobacter sp. LR185c]